MSFAQYEKLTLLGKSHIGAVYECLDSKHGHTVAALEVTEQIAETMPWDDAWGEILKYYRGFKHEYIVPVRDTDKDQRLIIMELMKDSMRSELKKKERIQPDVVRRCLRRCLEALSEVHLAGLIHGDIRPDQLLFNREGRFRLSFSVGLKPGGVVIRRDNYNQYLAPELLNPSAGPVGPQVDLYALGVTAYEMLVGTAHLTQLVPGVGPNAPEPQKQWLKWQADLNGSLPQLREIFKNVPKDLAEVVDGLVQKKTSSRFKSAKEALDRLEAGSVDDDILIPLADLQASPAAQGKGPSHIQRSGDEGQGYQSASGLTDGPPSIPPGVNSPSLVPRPRPVSQVGGVPSAVPNGPATEHEPPPKAKGLLLWGGTIAVLALMIGLGTYVYVTRSSKTADVPRSPARKDPATDVPPPSVARMMSGTIDPPRAKLLIKEVLVEVKEGRWQFPIPSPADQIEISATHEGFASLQQFVKAGDLEKPISLVLDPYVAVIPPDVTVSLDGKELKVARGRVRIAIPEGEEHRVTLARGDIHKDFTVTRESLAGQGYRIELPLPQTPPPRKEYAIPDGLEAVADSPKGKSTHLPIRVRATKLAAHPGSAEFVLVEPGAFQFGPSEPKRLGDAETRSEKVVAPYYIATFETTVAQFRAFEAEHREGATASPEMNPTEGAMPAVSIPVDRMLAYSKWLSPNGRLPTEVEWEYAARFDLEGERPLPEVRAGSANCDLTDDNLLPSEGKLVAVDALPESRTSRGLFQLLGNAAEVCNTPFSQGFQLDRVPKTLLVARGGSYLEGQESLNVFVRDAVPPAGDPFVGFRVVVECAFGSATAAGTGSVAPNVIGD